MSDPNLTYTGIEIYKDILSFPKKVEFPHYAGNNKGWDRLENHGLLKK